MEEAAESATAAARPPSLPPNYVTLAQLQEQRRLKQEEELRRREKAEEEVRLRREKEEEEVEERLGKRGDEEKDPEEGEEGNIRGLGETKRSPPRRGRGRFRRSRKQGQTGSASTSPKLERENGAAGGGTDVEAGEEKGDAVRGGGRGRGAGRFHKRDRRRYNKAVAASKPPNPEAEGTIVAAAAAVDGGGDRTDGGHSKDRDKAKEETKHQPVETLAPTLESKPEKGAEITDPKGPKQQLRNGSRPSRGRRAYQPVKVPEVESDRTAEIARKLGDLKVVAEGGRGEEGRVGADGGEGRERRRSTVQRRGGGFPREFGLRRCFRRGAATVGDGMAWVRKTTSS